MLQGRRKTSFGAVGSLLAFGGSALARRGVSLLARCPSALGRTVPLGVGRGSCRCCAGDQRSQAVAGQMSVNVRCETAHPQHDEVAAPGASRRGLARGRWRAGSAQWAQAVALRYPARCCAGGPGLVPRERCRSARSGTRQHRMLGGAICGSRMERDAARGVTAIPCRARCSRRADLR